jgi:DNA-directed RNA polymerase specialized sigma24 family protein
MLRAAFQPISHDRIAQVIDRVLGSFIVRGHLRSDEADDVRSTVTLRVLQQFEDGGRGGNVRSADDYIARMTINAVNDVLRGRRLAPVELDAGDIGEPIDAAPEAEDVFASRQMLELLWVQIGQLPLMQRRALLLHVHDDVGGSAIQLLIFTGIATLDDVAIALDYSREAMEAMWDRLPMQDLAIAEMLEMTRPQVVSLRRAARERLERARRRLMLPLIGKGRLRY